MSGTTTTAASTSLHSRQIKKLHRFLTKSEAATTSSSSETDGGTGNDLEAKVVMATLPKLTNLDMKRLDSQPKLVALTRKGQRLSQQDLYVIHATLSQLHHILEAKVISKAVPSDLRPLLKRAYEANLKLVHLLFKYLVKAKTGLYIVEDPSEFKRHYRLINEVFPFL